MLAFMRLVIFGFLFLTVLYLAISYWSRTVRARKLEREWEQEGGTGDKDAYIRKGLTEYGTSFRRKLILLVYIVPVVAVVVVIYMTNFR